MRVTRRAVLAGAGALLAAPALGASAAEAAPKRIPATGEPVPAVGIGSWITFNVGDDPLLRAECRAVMAAFFEAGGGIVDSSPMYGSSQEVIGDALATLGRPPGLFSGRQGLDRRLRRPRAARGDDPALGRRALRPAAGSQSDRLGSQSRYPRRHEGGPAGCATPASPPRTAAGTTSSRRSCAAGRPISCSSPTTSWIGRRKRRLLPLALERGIRGHLQPAVPAGPAA